MLTFLEFIKEDRREAEKFVGSLLEQASKSDDFTLSKDQRSKMQEILQVYPEILQVYPEILNANRKVMYLGSKHKPDLDSYDRRNY